MFHNLSYVKQYFQYDASLQMNSPILFMNVGKSISMICSEIASR